MQPGCVGCVGGVVVGGGREGCVGKSVGEDHCCCAAEDTKEVLGLAAYG